MCCVWERERGNPWHFHPIAYTKEQERKENPSLRILDQYKHNPFYDIYPYKNYTCRIKTHDIYPQVRKPTSQSIITPRKGEKIKKNLLSQPTRSHRIFFSFASVFHPKYGCSPRCSHQFRITLHLLNMSGSIPTIRSTLFPQKKNYSPPPPEKKEPMILIPHLNSPYNITRDTYSDIHICINNYIYILYMYIQYNLASVPDATSRTKLG